MKSKLLRYLSILSATIALTGCASFRNNEVAEVESLPDVSQYQNKPSVFVEVSFYRGKLNEGASEAPAVKPNAQEIVGKVLGESGLFSKYSFNSADKQGSDYVFHVDIYNHGDIGAAVASGFITGLPLCLVPSKAVDHYTLRTRLTDNAGKLINEASNEDSIATWFGLWFLPAASNTLQKAFSQTLENQLKAVLKELVESGKLEYSQASPYATHRLLARK